MTSCYGVVQRSQTKTYRAPEDVVERRDVRLHRRNLAGRRKHLMAIDRGGRCKDSSALQLSEYPTFLMQGLWRDIYHWATTRLSTALLTQANVADCSRCRHLISSVTVRKGLGSLTRDRACLRIHAPRCDPRLERACRLSETGSEGRKV